MKKLSKLLVLILTLALLVTVFAVVALASDGDEPKLTPVTVTGDNFNFEDKETGFLISQTSDKDGVWYVGEADNGNKYAVAAYDNGTGSNGQNWDPTFHNNSKLGIDQYPIFAFDFDVRSTTGGWHWGLTMRADLYGGPGGYNARLSQTATRKLNNDGFKLSGKDEWNHVTYVVEYAGNGVFNFISYVNGLKTSSTSINYNETKFSAQYNANASIVYFNDLLDENGNFKYSNVRIHCVSLYPPTGETTEQIHYDNLSVTYFPTGYSADDAAKYTYNESYEFPYNYTVAKNGDAVYDDVSEAVADAKEGDTILLTANAAKDIVIDKPMSIDTSNGTYTFDWVSYNGYTVASSADGVYTFAKSEQTVTVKWDPACSGACNCFDAAGGHSLNATTVVALGTVPEHPVQNPSFDVTADKRQAFFLGWSYDNDGTVDDITAISEEQIALGEISLYPIYDVKVYALEVTTTAGKVTYHVQEEFKEVVEGIAYEATLKLVRDVNIDSGTIKIKRSFTLDLNGHSLMRCFNYGNVYAATKDEDGNFVFGTDKLINTVGIQRDMFTAYGYNAHLIITSSVGGGNLYATNMHCDTWTYEGEVVKRTAKALSSYNTSTVGSGFLVMISYQNESQGFDLTINNGVSIFTGALWYQDGASHTGFNYILENMNFYRISPYWVNEGAKDSLDIMSSRSDEAFNCLIQFIYVPTGNVLTGMLHGVVTDAEEVGLQLSGHLLQKALQGLQGVHHIFRQTCRGLRRFHSSLQFCAHSCQPVSITAGEERIRNVAQLGA